MPKSTDQNQGQPREPKPSLKDQVPAVASGIKEAIQKKVHNYRKGLGPFAKRDAANKALMETYYRKAALPQTELNALSNKTNEIKETLNKNPHQDALLTLCSKYDQKIKSELTNARRVVVADITYTDKHGNKYPAHALQMMKQGQEARLKAEFKKITADFEKEATELVQKDSNLTPSIQDKLDSMKATLETIKQKEKAQKEELIKNYSRDLIIAEILSHQNYHMERKLSGDTVDARLKGNDPALHKGNAKIDDFDKIRFNLRSGNITNEPGLIQFTYRKNMNPDEVAEKLLKTAIAKGWTSVDIQAVLLDRHADTPEMAEKLIAAFHRQAAKLNNQHIQTQQAMGIENPENLITINSVRTVSRASESSHLSQRTKNRIKKDSLSSPKTQKQAPEGSEVDKEVKRQDTKVELNNKMKSESNQQKQQKQQEQQEQQEKTTAGISLNSTS